MEMFMKKRKVDDVETVCYPWAQTGWSYQTIDLLWVRKWASNKIPGGIGNMV